MHGQFTHTQPTFHFVVVPVGREGGEGNKRFKSSLGALKLYS